MAEEANIPETPEVPRPSRRRRVWRLLKRLALGFIAILTVFITVIVVDGWRAFGKAPEGERLERMHASPQWDAEEEEFVNPQALWNSVWVSLKGAFNRSDFTSPDGPIPVDVVDPARFATPPASGLRVTWLGHSTVLIEIDGVRVLTDPVWGERTSPVDWLGPSRWYAPPLALDDVPPVDLVVISHDHYDHLDMPTITAMADWDTRFVTPLGVGAHLEYWGVPADHITELDWWDAIDVAGLHLTATPARHASGRHVFDQNRTLWAGYAMKTAHHNVFFSGDTGLFPAMHRIGEELGPFDIAMVEVGAYDQGWPDWHIGPEQAVLASQWLKGEVFLPIHWGLFDLANHGWTEPMERVLVEAEARGVRVATPRPGGSVEPATVGPAERWWPEAPWRTAEAYPIVSTKVEH